MHDQTDYRQFFSQLIHTLCEALGTDSVRAKVKSMGSIILTSDHTVSEVTGDPSKELMRLFTAIAELSPYTAELIIKPLLPNTQTTQYQNTV